MSESHHHHSHSHEHNEHEHNHEHIAADSNLSPLWVGATSVGNLGFGGTEIAAGLGGLGTNANTMSLVSEGVHSFLGDSLAFLLQGINVVCKLPEKRKQQLRKATFWIMAASSVSVGMKTGMDMGHQSEPHNNVGLYSGLGSLAFSGVMYGLYRQKVSPRKQDRSIYEQDILDHFHHVDFPFAALAAFGAGIQHVSPLAEQVAAIGSAAWGTWKFRPTKKNMQGHVCPAHPAGVHGHPPEPAEHGAPDKHRFSSVLKKLIPPRAETKTPKRRRVRRIAKAIGTVGLGLTAFTTVFSGALAEPAYEPNPKAPLHATQPDTARQAPGVAKDKRSCHIVKRGESQWSVSEDLATAILGRHATTKETAAVAAQTVSLNKHHVKDPDLIHAGACLNLPTTSFVRSLALA